MYKVEDLVRIAKREKNKKRSYLFVNPLQGKHIPANPIEVDQLCATLAEKIDVDYGSRRKFVIGFAETATGIAAATCSHMENVIAYEHTTREYNEKHEYIYFTESHSHAKEQLLDRRGLGQALQKAEIIILIDDEITTGNTVCKLIYQINKEFGFSGSFVIASFVNSMTNDRIKELEAQGIECRYVIRIPHEYKSELAESVGEEENTDVCFDREDYVESVSLTKIKFNPREAVSWDEYFKNLNSVAEQIAYSINIKSLSTVGVIGTEEFMYLTILLGEKLKNRGVLDVRVHSTTRSPIVPSCQDGYPLNARYKLHSLYDSKRVTYIYNLIHYDKVLIVTDGNDNNDGLLDLFSAVKSVGNKSITIYRCEYEE
ncbi:phosphoribosyltransferase domain-containing protein [Butyrivibrio sp. AC2005]|uniref:phosphoribosyltransferase domain-containing protein n=1 Tax=Butyrivibrio sp. AC2005 TaxID=1280672 RepID=UPI0004259D48|nr:phosphoribosyltransferase domain-containing protein [Butyrivibrio sp. AC2005]